MGALVDEYLGIAWEATRGYAAYLWRDVTTPSLHSYFYLLIATSVVVYVLELVRPWRRDQPKVRRDFWLDGFYMFFNFFLFSLIGFNAASEVVSHAFSRLLGLAGIENLVAIRVSSLPAVLQLAILFVFRDFIHFWVHRLLHRVPSLWRFHRLHHSVKEMGFAAHLRFHPMETVLYRTLEYMPLSLVGFGIDDFLIVHALSLTIGHLNHANVRIPLGPLRYVFNSAGMHIWHHARAIEGQRRVVNFGLSLSVWDYIFGTAYWPQPGRDEELGFEGDVHFPRGFLAQMIEPFRRRR